MICTPNRQGNDPRRFQSAFTLVETMLGSMITVLVFGALLVAIAYGFGEMHASSENTRATEVLLERMEGLRLYNWNQLVSSNLADLDFDVFYSPAQGTNVGSGAVYHGAISVGNPALNPPASYSGDMRLVTVTVTWTNNNGNQRQRSMSTFVSRYGVQNYIYGR